MTVGLVTSPGYLAHDTGPGNPERPERLVAIHERLARSGLAAELDALEASPASRAALFAVHPPGYVEHVAEAVASNARWVDSPDANVGSESFAAALLAAGGALAAVDRVVRGEWRTAFVAARPPGHHAEEQLAMGFCLFNNAAVAARHLQHEHGVERVAILDWDVHHGNGTQHLFERDPTVFYASLHQYPHYPGTGAAGERGLGEGRGATLNLPQDAGSGDREWLAALEEEALPALQDFDPGFVIVSAGFDAHVRDPLSATRVSTGAYAEMTRLVLALARRCGGRVVSLLEGGYDLEGLASSVEAHVGALVEGDRAPE